MSTIYLVMEDYGHDHPAPAKAFRTEAEAHEFVTGCDNYDKSKGEMWALYEPGAKEWVSAHPNIKWANKTLLDDSTVYLPKKYFIEQVELAE